MPNCPYCGSAVASHAVDRERDLATCVNCHHLIDLRRFGETAAGAASPYHAQSPMGIPATGMPPPGTWVSGSYPSGAGATAAPPDAGTRPRMRPIVGLPPGMTIEQEESSFIVGSEPAALTITRRWFRPKHIVMLLVVLAAGVGLGHYAVGTELGVTWGLLALLWLFLDYTLIKMLVNRTTIRAAQGVVEVKHGPLPSLTVKGSRFNSDQIQQLYAQQVSARYSVMVTTKDGQSKQLVAPVLVEPEQALFIEQQIERALGITDFEVPGELGGQLPQLLKQASNPTKGKTPAAVAGVAALAPLLIGGSIAALVIFLTKVELSGSVQLADAWVLTPDDCESGQRRNFFGVTLLDTQAPGAFVRVMTDPIRGNVVLLNPGTGAKNVLLSANDCSQFDVQVHTTNTTINDIRALDATLRLQCNNVTANVTAENCH